MKILNTGNLYSESFKNKSHSYPEVPKKKIRAKEFKQIFEQSLNEVSDDPEDFRILLPKHGHFWDNGYEDLE